MLDSLLLISHSHTALKEAKKFPAEADALKYEKTLNHRG